MIPPDREARVGAFILAIFSVGFVLGMAVTLLSLLIIWRFR